MDLAAPRLVGEQVARWQDLCLGDVAHERLPAEAGLDGHHRHDVQQLAIRLERGERRRGAERQPRCPAGRPDPAQHGLDRLADLDMDGDRVAAGLEELIQPAARLVDHQVRVERDLGHRAERPDGARAEREVRDEVGVHHVEVDPVGTGPDHPAHLVGEVAQVRVEDAGRDPRPTFSHQRLPRLGAPGGRRPVPGRRSGWPAILGDPGRGVAGRKNAGRGVAGRKNAGRGVAGRSARPGTT